MKKVILFALIALLAAPANLIMAENTAARLIKENRDKEFTFYVNCTNRHTAWRTYNKSARKARKELLEAYGDSISEDSINKMIPNPKGMIISKRISKLKRKVLVQYDTLVQDFAAELDKARDVYCQFEINSIADTVLLDGRNKEMAKLILNMLPSKGGASFYYTDEKLTLNPGYAFILYSEDRKLQTIVYVRHRPFRIFF